MAAKADLVLTDSLEWAKGIARALRASPRSGYFEGNGYVIAHYGSAPFELAEPEVYDPGYVHWRLSDLPIIPERFKWEPAERSTAQFSVLKGLRGKREFDRVVIAAEPTPEGEYGARLVLGYIGVVEREKVFRVSTSRPPTASAVWDAFDDIRPDSEWDLRCASAEMTDRAEWLIGTNLSRLLSLVLGSHQSFGRISTTVLRLIVDREQEVREGSGSLVVKFRKSGGEEVWARLHSFGEQAEEMATFRRVAETGTGVARVVARSRRDQKGSLLDLTGLQVRAQRRYGYAARKTDRIAERLHLRYGAISYPRSSVPEIGRSRRLLLAEAAQLAPRGAGLGEAALGHGNMEGAGTAILALKEIPGTATNEERNVYTLVREGMAGGMGLGGAATESVRARIEIAGMAIEARFASGAEVHEGETLAIVGKARGDRGLSGRRFTEADVLELLAERGIGSAGSRVHALSRLVERGYCRGEAATVWPTSEGVKLIGACNRIGGLAWFLDIDAVSRFGARLRDEPVAASGELVARLREVCRRSQAGLRRVDQKLLPYSCPICGSPLRDEREAVACSSGTSECSFRLGKVIAGHTLTDADLIALTKRGRSYGPPAWFQSARGGRWKGRLYYSYGLSRVEIEYLGRRYSVIPPAAHKPRVRGD